jgi:hypothetical protein
MKPSHDTNHQAEALAYLTEQFKNATTLKGLISAVMISVQDAEDMLWEVIETRLLNGSLSGDQEDQIGAIVGESRDGRDDADYLTAIYVKIRVNRSQGRGEDLIEICALLKPALNTSVTPNTTVLYQESYPAGWKITLLNPGATTVISINELATLLFDAKALGTYGNLEVGTPSSPSVGDVFILGSRYATIPGQAYGLSDRYSTVAEAGILADARGI